MFSKRTYDEILNFFLERISKETDITLTTPGGVARTLLEIVSKEMASNFNVFDFNFAQSMVSTASGSALDAFGVLFGVTRKSVDPSINAESKLVYFYLNDSGPLHEPGVPNLAAGTTITIPTGTYISTDEVTTIGNPILWKTTAPVTIETGYYLGYATVMPVNNGDISVSPGAILYHNLETEAYPNIYVYNKGSLISQPSFESDENYRYRIINGLRLLATGNLTALRVGILAVNGVRDVRIRPLEYGIGTVGILVIPERPGTNDAVNAYGRALTVSENIKSAGDIIFVRLPDFVKIDVTAKILLDSDNLTRYNSNIILDSVNNEIRKHINSLSVGENLTISSIIGAAIKVSPFVKDCTILSGGGIMVDDMPHDLSTITVGENEQIYAGNITVS